MRGGTCMFGWHDEAWEGREERVINYESVKGVDFGEGGR